MCARTEINGNGSKRDGKHFAREFLFLCKSSQKFVKPSSVKNISITCQNLIVKLKIKKIQASLSQYNKYGLLFTYTRFASNSSRAGPDDLSFLPSWYYYPSSERLLRRSYKDPISTKNIGSRFRILFLGLLLDPWMEWQNSFLPLMPNACWNLQKWQIENQNLSWRTTLCLFIDDKLSLQNQNKILYYYFSLTNYLRSIVLKQSLRNNESNHM